jgi:hypothetical protein
MKIIVEHNGKTYESAENSDITAEQAKIAVYERFDDFTKFEMELKTGGYLLLGRDAVQSCAFTILDT